MKFTNSKNSSSSQKIDLNSNSSHYENSNKFNHPNLTLIKSSSAVPQSSKNQINLQSHQNQLNSLHHLNQLPLNVPFNSKFPISAFYEKVNNKWVLSDNWSLYGISGSNQRHWTRSIQDLNNKVDDSNHPPISSSLYHHASSAQLDSSIQYDMASTNSSNQKLDLPAGWNHTSRRGPLYVVPAIVITSLFIAISLLGLAIFLVMHRRDARRQAKIQNKNLLNQSNSSGNFQTHSNFKDEEEQIENIQNKKHIKKILKPLKKLTLIKIHKLSKKKQSASITKLDISNSSNQSSLPSVVIVQEAASSSSRLLNRSLRHRHHLTHQNQSQSPNLSNPHTTSDHQLISTPFTSQSSTNLSHVPNMSSNSTDLSSYSLNLQSNQDIGLHPPPQRLPSSALQTNHQTESLINNHLNLNSIDSSSINASTSNHAQSNISPSPTTNITHHSRKTSQTSLLDHSSSLSNLDDPRIIQNLNPSLNRSTHDLTISQPPIIPTNLGTFDVNHHNLPIPGSSSSASRPIISNSELDQVDPNTNTIISNHYQANRWRSQSFGPSDQINSHVWASDDLDTGTEQRANGILPPAYSQQNSEESNRVLEKQRANSISEEQENQAESTQEGQEEDPESTVFMVHVATDEKLIIERLMKMGSSPQGTAGQEPNSHSDIEPGQPGGSRECISDNAIEPSAPPWVSDQAESEPVDSSLNGKDQDLGMIVEDSVRLLDDCQVGMSDLNILPAPPEQLDYPSLNNMHHLINQGTKRQAYIKEEGSKANFNDFKNHQDDLEENAMLVLASAPPMLEEDAAVYPTAPPYGD
ncbi:hypothetical protein O181_068300 [Austropuccinia psidii MF-1]|uniref:Uncharacterized protein n=1 Tax=Austropuccinia psidii MF-1 TaxID=1389203 RepID=A0A9Q3ESA7_9BASI|nr:hypothetical protein [Austropuccinia psidii MF-1]